MNDTEEMLTVTEAARRLGISERQARRDVRQLSGADRHESGRGPVRVRLSALRAVRNGNAESQSAIHDTEAASAKSDDGMSGMSPALAGHAPDMEADQSRSESGVGETVTEAIDDGRDLLIAQLTGENQRLNAALERAQEGLLKALDSLADERGRVRQLEQLEAKLIQALPAPAAEVTEQKQAASAPWWVRLFGQKD